MTPALPRITKRQSDILHRLRGEGLSVEDIAGALAVSRPAASKHLEPLLQAGLVQEEVQESTGGRPRRLFRLTGRGRELFPRQYGWFLGLLMESLKKERGGKAVSARLKKLAQSLAAEKEPSFHARPGGPRLKEIADFMNTLGFEASAKSGRELVARNCVYHDLARDHPEVCSFDIALIEGLSQAKVEHTECLVRGGKACRFRLCASKNTKK